MAAGEIDKNALIESFSRIKEDILKLKQEIELLKNENSELKEIIKKNIFINNNLNDTIINIKSSDNKITKDKLSNDKINMEINKKGIYESNINSNYFSNNQIKKNINKNLNEKINPNDLDLNTDNIYNSTDKLFNSINITSNVPEIEYETKDKLLKYIELTIKGIVENSLKKSRKNRFIEKINKKRKNILINRILGFAEKKNFTTSEIKDIIVDQENLCSKATFYRYIEKLKNKQLIDIIKIDDNEIVTKIYKD